MPAEFYYSCDNEDRKEGAALVLDKRVKDCMYHYLVNYMIIRLVYLLLLR